MTDVKRLEERLTAVERTVVDGDFELDELTDVAALAENLQRIESHLDALEERVAQAEASTQSIDGYVSNVRTVNETVEKQADAAIAAVDRIEYRLELIEDRLPEDAADAETELSEEVTEGHAEDSQTTEPAGIFDSGSNESDDPLEVLESSGKSREERSNHVRPGENNETTSEPLTNADQESIERRVQRSERPEPTSDTEREDSDDDLPSVLEFLRMKFT